MAKMNKSQLEAAAVLAAMREGAELEMYRSAMGSGRMYLDRRDGSKPEQVSERAMNVLWSMRPLPIWSDASRKNVYVLTEAGRKAE